MNKKTFFVGVSVVLIAGAGVVFYKNRHNISSNSVTAASQAANVAMNVAPSASSTLGSTSSVQFSNSPYASNAYLISTTSTYNASTSQALKGFQVKKKVLSDGSLQITLIALQSEYPTKTYTVASSEKLYFVEASVTDDSVSEDHAPADDRVILVNASGIIL